MNTDVEMERRLLAILARHRGLEHPIGMGELYTSLVGETGRNIINVSSPLRVLIRRLRRRGEPICSTSDKRNPGYYLAESAEELKEFFGRFRQRALSSLEQISHMERLALAKLEGQGEVISG